MHICVFYFYLFEYYLFCSAYMVAVQSVLDKGLVIFTPLVQSAEHNVVRVSR